MASEEGYVILDVRTVLERIQGHPSGSISITLDSLSCRVDELKGMKILAFCHSGDRSNAATRFLNHNGIEALNVTGGMIAWTHADLPTTSGSSP